MKTMLEAQNLQRKFYYIVLAGLALGVALNAALVGSQGAVGASAAYFAGISCCACLGYACVSKSLSWGVLLVSCLRVVLAAAAAGLALWLVLPVSLLLALAASGVIYLGSLLALGELNCRTLL